MSTMNIEKARFNMVEQQIRPWRVLDPDVLGLLSVVRREDFVPAAYRHLAFVDTEAPLPQGQCMLTPQVEARLLQAAQLRRHENVLEIGAGSGYMAALLAHRAHAVVTMEIRPELASLAQTNLQRAGIGNVRVQAGDASAGLNAEAPFDLIMLSGSVAAVPQALLAQLKPGGRLLAIVGELPIMRAQCITRAADGGFSTTELFDTVAQRLDGFAEAPRFHF